MMKIKGKVIAGPFFMFIYILVILMTQGTGFQIPDSIGVFSIIIIISIFIGDLSSGIISSIIAVGYLFYSFTISNNKIYYHYRSFFNILEEAIILFGVVLIISLLKRNIRQKSQALIESENKFKELFNNANDAIFLHGLTEDGKLDHFIEVNDAACKKFGYTKKEFSSMTPYDIVPREFYDKELCILKKDKDNSNVTLEFPFITKGGIALNMEVNAHVFYLNGEKVVSATVRDITKCKKNEKKLKESEESYRQLVNFFPDAICVHKNGKIIFGNDGVLDLFGVKSKEEILGKSVMAFIKKDYHEMVNKRIQDVKSVGDTAPLMEEKLIGVDGREIDVEVKTTCIIYKGENATLVAVRDITERKKAEELQKKVEINKKMLDEVKKYDKIKTEFFANISHELRTPLNIILGTVQILDVYRSKMPNIDADIKLEKRINIMRQNCFRLIRLVNNLIDITKIDAGYYDISMGNHNIVHIVEEITLSVAQYIEDKGVILTFDTEVEEKIMSCDTNKIERIILNLLSNAVKFTKPGDNIIVNIYDKGDNISISVKDTGIGIPESKMNMIFERFAQVDKSLNRNREGSGIGLSMVKALVEMQGGSITLKSEYGVGSEFIINLPVRIIEENDEREWARIDLPEALIEMINIEFSDIYS
ncbi:PAS domain-containing sensor histidine kinase [Oceanirhabdus seepicola]|uniref:histidine kinase n=1 Tax=Oceanirhabdus seepicola TaxID=2828781 RepID=A0A9J6NXY8_9CLOT|nr:PAS domain-containing sensor histidine kinase [Oceanirhabdus seepicola]MCM1988761.1 PAS domain S-box protein [Oceanirhabdus seepicola]